MLLIMIPDRYPNYYKALEIYTGYFDSLDNMMLLSYPSSILIMSNNYCITIPLKDWSKCIKFSIVLNMFITVNLNICFVIEV